MCTQGASTSSPSSSSTRRWKYDVFLNFRGVDTRNSFTDHLYAALKQKGILTFKYDKKIDRGKAIAREILEKIEGSRFAIVILSKHYAPSTWCLDELVKIIGYSKEMGTTVLPVFYDVDPSDVRRQRGTFAVAFAKQNTTLTQVFTYMQMITINMSAEDDTRVLFILCLAAKWGGFSQEDFS
uniref:ADP-ribosyl cyclase/cyclic ADP-ribose hydrolase n=1 Tax=Quercus lobata TaxID=97700 RepID=A0A7N2RA22_QUELO